MYNETGRPKFFRLRPITPFELISITIALTSLYLAWLQASGGSVVGQ